MRFWVSEERVGALVAGREHGLHVFQSEHDEGAPTCP